jgi:hypothetical protein
MSGIGREKVMPLSEERIRQLVYTALPTDALIRRAVAEAERAMQEQYTKIYETQQDAYVDGLRAGRNQMKARCAKLCRYLGDREDMRIEESRGTYLPHMCEDAIREMKEWEMSIDQWEERAAVIADAERWRWIAPRLNQLATAEINATEAKLVFADVPPNTKAQADAAVDKAREEK